MVALISQPSFQCFNIKTFQHDVADDFAVGIIESIFVFMDIKTQKNTYLRFTF